MFERVCHADWSVDPRKRWAAQAERTRDGWVAGTPSLVGPPGPWLDHAFAPERDGALLLGLDVAIGLPRAYGRQTGFDGFKSALRTFGHGSWGAFFEIARDAGDISIRRPFYPARAVRGVRRDDLVAGLGVATFGDLLRDCDRGDTHGRAAASAFWTLGANQVGKAAISGWREVLLPALARGAALWPFDGGLHQLASRHRMVIAETYPALAYARIGAAFRQGESKRRQADRRSKAEAIRAWAERRRIGILPQAWAMLKDGFGAAATGEDAFDAFAGLLAMVDVSEADGCRTHALPCPVDAWEGWILGR